MSGKSRLEADGNSLGRAVSVQALINHLQHRGGVQRRAEVTINLGQRDFRVCQQFVVTDIDQIQVGLGWQRDRRMKSLKRRSVRA